MYNKTGILSIIIIAVIMVQLAMTLTLAMAPGTDPTEIYVRNFSSMGALLVLAFFFDIFSFYHTPAFTDTYKKRMKIITLILAVASLAKAAVSAVYAATYFHTANIVLVYYLGETLVWAAVFIFAASYYSRLKRKTSNRVRSKA